MTPRERAVTNAHAGIELQPVMYVLMKNGKPLRARWPRGIFRFKRGQNVWVKDLHKVTPAKVRERHYHPDRHPFYPNGEGYTLDGQLWWDCYPGCRVFHTKEEAKKARLPRND